MKDELEIQNRCVALIGAVIKFAIVELKYIKSPDSQVKKIGIDAYDFLTGEGLERYCKLVNVNASYVRLKLKDKLEKCEKYRGNK